VSFLEELGPPVEEINEKDYEEKIAKISPFQFAESISNTKVDLIETEQQEAHYNPFIVNRALSFGHDTVIAANEMNSRPHIDAKMQYDFLRSVIRKGKRYNKWLKPEESNLEAIQEYFGYSFNKAKEALRILSEEDINLIKIKLKTSKGGKV
tara:strand:- start:489 stop:944 length:456 start_codon:yes stop_codon:yes gene_type:complete